jgi:hypothetical protein
MGQTIAAWCRETKTARSTAFSWSREPGFARDVATVQRRVLAQAIGRLTGAVVRIADGMIELATSAANESTRLSAQRAVLASLYEVTELVEIKDRLTTLERRDSEEQHAD